MCVEVATYGGGVSPLTVDTKTPLAHVVVSPIVTCTGGVFPSTHTGSCTKLMLRQLALCGGGFWWWSWWWYRCIRIVYVVVVVVYNYLYIWGDGCNVLVLVDENTIAIRHDGTMQLQHI